MTPAPGSIPAPGSAPEVTTRKSMDDIVALCRRRGFIWQSSEIYGGINGFWDYGPLGTELKRNLKDAWWHDIVKCPPVGPDGNLIDMVGLDCTIIMNPKVWEASGHVAGFNDPMVDDRQSKKRYRADKVWIVGYWSPEHWNAWKELERELSTFHPDGVAAVARAISALEKDFESIKQGLQEGRFTSEVEAQIRDFLLFVAHETDPGANSAPTLEERLRNVTSSLPRLRMPTFAVAVEADSFEEAARRSIEKLTRQERKRVTEQWHVEGFDLIHLPPTWPRLSPESQAPTLTEPRQFNLMFESHIGAVRNDESRSYLRPETAQGIFCNFRNVVDTSRVKVPFGIAQVGKAFRNEVTPRNFTFRSREFEQMEIEFFIRPETADEWYAYWRDSRFAWWQSIGLAGENLQLREHDRDELAHYAKDGAGTSDIEYRFPFTSPGFGELEGVAHRTDFDLRQHAEHSGLKDKLKYFDQEKNERYFPHVIEPSAGADRGTLALICEAYTPDETRPSKVFMKFHPRMAPIKAAVFPLVNKDGMPEIAEELYRQLRRNYTVEYDAKQSIGKRYARMDEAGTPYCFTIDGETVSGGGSGTVTVRHRDTQQQERIGIDHVPAFLAEKIGG